MIDFIYNEYGATYQIDNAVLSTPMDNHRNMYHLDYDIDRHAGRGIVDIRQHLHIKFI